LVGGSLTWSTGLPGGAGTIVPAFDGGGSSGGDMAAAGDPSGGGGRGAVGCDADGWRGRAGWPSSAFVEGNPELWIKEGWLEIVEAAGGNR
jgi:hypothetical protein